MTYKSNGIHMNFAVSSRSSAAASIAVVVVALFLGGCDKAHKEAGAGPVEQPKPAPMLETAQAAAKPTIDTEGGWLRLLDEKAEAGDTAAQLIMGAYYSKKLFHNKPNEESDARKKGFELTMKAAMVGDAAAQFSVGLLYLQGSGVFESQIKASEWILKAANQHFSPAEDRMCQMYANGVGVEKDVKKAETYCRSALKHGLEKSRSYLPWLQAGNNAERIARLIREKSDDYEILASDKASGYFFKYSHRFAPGQTDLTLKAVDLYRQAAIAGQPEAQLEVAHMYYYGDGTARDVVLGYAWALIAKQNKRFAGYKVSSMLNVTGHKYTTKEKNEAEAIAADWKVGLDLLRVNVVK